MKAIIMAGGEGTRLRPLTCDCPKPMMHLMNEPVMAHALRLLRAHGVTQAAATLGYLPHAITDYFGDGAAFGLDLRYYIEDRPLGTALGVRRAADFLDETFAVLSGDGITDLNLSDALHFHRSRGALATLVLARSDRPLDYGVVCLHPDGRVRSFHEKPDWCDVLSDTVNTGIYILEPELLPRIPEDRPCDFGRDVFPALVRQGLPVYGYVMEGYWCDIGDVRAYLAAHQDALEGRIHLEGLMPRSSRAVLMPGAQVDRAAVLEGPCLIGENARVMAGAYVGPGSVVGREAFVGEGASLKRAVLWTGARLEAGAQARGCVLAGRAALGMNAQAYEESVLGTGARLGARAVALPGVKLWPGRACPDGTRLERNLVWGGAARMAFAGGAMPLADPAQAVRAAQAAAAALHPSEVLLGRGEDVAALWHAAAAGLMAQGVSVWDGGAGPLNVLRCAQRALGGMTALWMDAAGLTILNPNGAPLTTPQQRAVAALCARQDFTPPAAKAVPALRPAGDWASLCAAQAAARLTRRCPPVAVWSDGASILSLAEEALRRAGADYRLIEGAAPPPLSPGEVGVFLDADAQRFCLMDEGGLLDEAQCELLLCWTALQSGERALLLPAHATRAVETLCRQAGARAEYFAGESSLWMNALADRSPEQFRLRFDGLYGAMSALDALAGAGLTLDGWRQRMPALARRTLRVELPPEQTGRALRALTQGERDAELGGGVRLKRPNGWAWVGPDARRGLRVVAESPDAEFARELCDFCAAALKKGAGEQSCLN